MFSEDLGECSHFSLGFSALSDRLGCLMYLYLELTPSTGTLAFGPNLWVQPLRFIVLWTFYMLRLAGGPSVNTLPLTQFDHSYPVSVASL